MLTEPANVFVRAEKALFAVYQTVYANADIELWFDWAARLADTQWTEDCFFVLDGARRIGGLIARDNVVMYPFLCAPNVDRRRFWTLVLQGLKNSGKPVEVRGALDEDVEVLLTLGFAVQRSRRMLCRPAEALPWRAPEGYVFREPNEQDMEGLVHVMLEAYKGGNDEAVFGPASREEVLEDMVGFFRTYRQTDSFSMSNVAIDLATNAVVGLCIAGVHPDVPNHFSGVMELAVLPAHRRKGLAEQLLYAAIDRAAPVSPLVRLCVTVGNAAEQLYRKAGFMPGPRFTNLIATYG